VSIPQLLALTIAYLLKICKYADYIEILPTSTCKDLYVLSAMSGGGMAGGRRRLVRRFSLEEQITA